MMALPQLRCIYTYRISRPPPFFGFHLTFDSESRGMYVAGGYTPWLVEVVLRRWVEMGKYVGNSMGMLRSSEEAEIH